MVETPPRDSAPPRLLVVDDEEAFCMAIVKYLRRQGYETTPAFTGEDALARIHDGQFELALLDVRMPGMNGIELVSELLNRDPDLAIIMLTAVDEAQGASACLQRGAMDYLTKPVDLGYLQQCIDLALRRRTSRIEDHSLSAAIKEELVAVTRELEIERERQHRIATATLDSLVHALEAKDIYQIGHSARIADLSASMAAELDLPDELIDSVRLAARLHDIGNIGIRDEFLTRKGELNDEERKRVQEHVLIGARILEPLEHLGSVVEFVRHHHENWDGSGYPDGLAGEDIPIGARIIGAAEIFDALSNDRPYQDPLSPADALEKMRPMVDRRLDPSIFKALVGAVKRRRTLTFVPDETPK